MGILGDKMTKIIKKILVFALTLALLVPSVSLAYDASGDSDDGPAATQKIVGGPTFHNSRYLLYLVNFSGEQLTKTQVIYQERVPAECNAFYNKTKFGGNINFLDYKIGSDWGYAPFNDDASGNGTRLKSWMLQKTNDVYNAFLITEKYFGRNFANLLHKGDAVLIVEGVYWGQMYKDPNIPTGVYLCANAHGWAYEQDRRGIGEYGAYCISKYTNNIFANCIKLEYTLYFSGLKK